MSLFLERIWRRAHLKDELMPTSRNPGRARLRSTAKPRNMDKSSRNAAAEATSQAAMTRREELIDEAARLFSLNGYERTSMRDIAAATGILAGSLYHHFESKEELFIAVYSLGVTRLLDAVIKATAMHDDPWTRLEVACVTHMQTLLGKDSYAAVVISHLSFNILPKQEQLVGLRDKYESIFKKLIDDLPLPKGTDRRIFRLGLLGAMNWAIVWYRQGSDTPAQIARKLLALLRTD